MRKIVLAVAFASIAAPVPVAAQTLIDQLIHRVGKKKPTSGATATGGQFAAAITPAQTAEVDRLLTLPLQDARVTAERAEAAPLIRMLLATGSCARNDAAWNAVNRFHMTPQTWGGIFPSYATMAKLNYHDSTKCLDVARLADWTKPANNALTFKAYYVAADSGEAGSQRFELQKSGEGQWMIRDIGYGSK